MLSPNKLNSISESLPSDEIGSSQVVVKTAILSLVPMARRRISPDEGVLVGCAARMTASPGLGSNRIRAARCALGKPRPALSSRFAGTAVGSNLYRRRDPTGFISHWSYGLVGNIRDDWLSGKSLQFFKICHARLHKILQPGILDHGC